MANSYLALGSNLNNPKQQIVEAIELISETPEIKVLKQSKLIDTKALIPAERPEEIQPDYVNAVIKIKTFLSPFDLLIITQSIETKMGRIKNALRWSARIIDIDILIYDEQIIQTSNLNIPHPQMSKRTFVMEPLIEMEPDFFELNPVFRRYF